MKELYTTNDLSYPLLLIGPENTIEVVTDSRKLNVTNKLGLATGIVLNNLIIDVNGNYFKTIRVTKQKNLNPFWKFEFFNPMILINIEMQKENPIEFEELKEKLKGIIKSEMRYWNFDSKSHVDLSIDSATNYKNLLLLLVSKK